MKSFFLYLLQKIAAWLHGITGEQWQYVSSLVFTAENMFSSGSDKLKWVKDQIANFIQSEKGKSVFSALSNAGLNWLIETAVGLLKK